MNNLTNFVLFLDDCKDGLIQKGSEAYDLLQFSFTVIRIVVPILLIVLVIKDLMTASAAGKEEDMKKAQSAAIKRIIIAVAIFFVPTVVNVLMGLIPGMIGTCGIG